MLAPTKNKSVRSKPENTIDLHAVWTLTGHLAVAYSLRKCA